MPSLRERANNRQRAIERFCKHQRVVRCWISLGDLVDWCVAISTTAGISKQKKARELALKSLTRSIQLGQFDGERQGTDVSKILYLAPYIPGDDAPPRC